MIAACVSRCRERETATAELSALGAERPRPARSRSRLASVWATFIDVFNPARLARTLAGVMLTVALLVLLVACANVANVLLVQAAVRSREVAVRHDADEARG